MLERLGVNTPKPIVYRELRSHIANLPNVEHHLHKLQCRLIMIQEVARVGASQDGEMSLLPATRESLARCSALAQRASDLTFSVRRELATWGSGTICATLLSPVDYPPLSEFREAKREQLLSTDLWHATEKWCAECKETIARALRSLDYLARLYRVDSKLFVRHARRYDQNEASWIGVIKNNAGARQRATADLVSLLSTDLADEVSALERSLHPALPSINQELDEFELVLQRFERGIESSLMEGSDNDLPPEAANHLRRAPHLTAFIRERLGVVKNANPSAAHDDATVDFDVTSEDWEPPPLGDELRLGVEAMLAGIDILRVHLETARAKSRPLLEDYGSTPKIYQKLEAPIRSYMGAIEELDSALSGPLVTVLVALADALKPSDLIQPRSSNGALPL